MNPQIASPTPFRHPTVHESDALGEWQLQMEADPGDVLVLSRILQKVALPSIELTSVNYERTGDVAHIAIRVRCPIAWMQLVRHKLSKLPAIRRLG